MGSNPFNAQGSKVKLGFCREVRGVCCWTRLDFKTSLVGSFKWSEELGMSMCGESCIQLGALRADISGKYIPVSIF